MIINYKCVAEERTIFKRIRRSPLEQAATRLANAVYHNNQERPRLHLLVYFCSSLSECLHLISTPLTLWFHLADAHKIAKKTLERVSQPTFFTLCIFLGGFCPARRPLQAHLVERPRGLPPLEREDRSTRLVSSPVDPSRSPAGQQINLARVEASSGGPHRATLISPLGSTREEEEVGGGDEEVLFIPMERRRRMTASATLWEKR